MPGQPDILQRIVAKRREDLASRGPSLGYAIPAKRERAIVPFLAQKGAILEIKRASPSAGAIAMDLDPVALARQYRDVGAKNVSVLTEEHFFKGSLDDLMSLSRAVPELSYLRKDFLLEEEEIEVAYRAGADAVLLIARILPLEKLRSMARCARDLGLTPFVEVREEEDLEKLARLIAEGPILAGVNARDLANFTIDPLIPAAVRSRLPERAVYESGIRGPGQAAFAGALGFTGILVGEAAARGQAARGRAAQTGSADGSAAPLGAASNAAAMNIVDAFLASPPSARGRFWRRVAERRGSHPDRRVPLVKVCGLKRLGDALLASNLGADLLGFVFAESPRAANTAEVKAVRAALGKRPALIERPAAAGRPPLLVAVVTELESPRAQEALDLAREGVLDAIQFHGTLDTASIERLEAALAEAPAGWYAAKGIETAADSEAVRALLSAGEPRVLVDASKGGRSGGTGQTISLDLVQTLARETRLWLAGGLGPGTTAALVDALKPELVDASSKLESAPGEKSEPLMRAWFEELHHVR